MILLSSRASSKKLERFKNYFRLIPRIFKANSKNSEKMERMHRTTDKFHCRVKTYKEAGKLQNEPFIEKEVSSS